MARFKTTRIGETKPIKKNKDSKTKFFNVRAGAWTYRMLLPVSDTQQTMTYNNGQSMDRLTVFKDEHLPPHIISVVVYLYIHPNTTPPTEFDIDNHIYLGEHYEQ